MFAISERTKRSLCRCLFLLGCCLPTTAIVCVALISRTTPYRNYVRRSWERSLSERFGLAVSLSDVTALRPNVWSLRDVHLSDSETNESVARISQVRLTRQAQTLDCVLTKPEVKGQHLPRLMNLLHERTLKGGLGAASHVSGYASSLDIQWAEQKHRLESMQWEVHTAADGARAELNFGLANDENQRLYELAVTRRLQPELPTTVLSLDTRGGRLPNPLLGIFLPQFAELGEHSQFVGRAIVHLTPASRSGSVTGELIQVDLESLVHHRHPGQLTGVADIQLQEFQFRRNGIERMQGTLTANDVTVGKPLLTDAIASFGLSYDRERCRFVERQPFRQLCFAFRLDHQGIGFVGACDRFPRGVVLRAFDSLLKRDVAIAWHDPARSVVPAVALVRMLHHSTATQEGATLLARLPLPSTDSLQMTPLQESERQEHAATAQLSVQSPAP